MHYQALALAGLSGTAGALLFAANHGSADWASLLVVSMAALAVSAFVAHCRDAVLVAVAESEQRLTEALDIAVSDTLIAVQLRPPVQRMPTHERPPAGLHSV